MDLEISHLEAQRAPMKAALIDLVRIPSVLAESTGDYPFGAAIDQALRKALEIADELGFRTQYGDGGYYGFAETGRGRSWLASWDTWMSSRPETGGLGKRTV